MDKANRRRAYFARRARLDALWKGKWITETELIRDRLWTRKMIYTFLGDGHDHGGYRFYAVGRVKKVEATEAFEDWLEPRLMAKLQSNPDFKLSPL